jgi:hypothetical protein
MQPLGTIYNALVRYTYLQTDRADRLMGAHFGVFVAVRCVWVALGTFRQQWISSASSPTAILARMILFDLECPH